MTLSTGKPNPGSDEAIEAGCQCPRLDNGYGFGHMARGVWVIDERCPIHLIEEFYASWDASEDRRYE